MASKPSRDLVTAAHQQITHQWWETRLTDFEVYISQFVLDEAGAGDADVATKRLALMGSFRLDATPEALNLARALVERGADPAAKATDAAHIAVATVHHMHFLMMINCTHLANAEIIAQVQTICAELGYAAPIVCTPEELLGGQDDPERYDPVVEEVRQIREQQAAELNFDLKAIFACARRRQKQSKRKTVSFADAAVSDNHQTRTEARGVAWVRGFK